MTPDCVQRFNLKETSALWKKATQIIGDLKLPIAKELHQRWAIPLKVRKGEIHSALDLQMVSNHLSTHPFYHRNMATIAAEEQEVPSPLSRSGAARLPSSQGDAVLLLDRRTCNSSGSQVVGICKDDSRTVFVEQRLCKVQ